MSNITMETDWGAKGAQLTGAQVQEFIKDELVKLQNQSKALQGQIKNLQQQIEEGGGSTGGGGEGGQQAVIQELQKQLETIQQQITSTQEQIKKLNQSVTEVANIQPDWLEGDKKSGNYIKNKPEIVTVETLPDQSLKSYVNVDGTTVNFKIGDFIRYKNEDDKYVFYQINDITEKGNVVWEEAGNGSNVDVRETVHITLSSNQAQPDNSLIGAVITVTDEDGETQLHQGTWQGEEIKIKVTAMTKYSVSVSKIDGYATPQTKKYTAAIQGERTVNMIYNTCLLTVETSGLENEEAHTISVKYGKTTKTIQNGQSVKVPLGESVEITASAVDGYTTPAKQTIVPQEASKTVTLIYIPSALRVTINSNQSDKSDLANLKATVTYNDTTVKVSSGQIISIPKGVEIRISFPELEGYAKPSDIVFTNQSGLAEKIGTYNTELVYVNVTASNSVDCSERTIKLTNTQSQAIIGTAKGSSTSFKVPFGISYKVSVDEWEGYDTPAEQTFMAGQVSRSVSIQYIYNPIKKGYYTIDDSVSDPATKITRTPEVIEVINWIRANSHRVLAKKTSDGVCKVVRLMDNDTTKYFDGTPAPITDTNYDVMMMMPEFWYTAEKDGENKWKIWFADGNPEDGKTWHKWDHGHLIGVYEAYNTSNKVYSVSGKDSTGNVSQANFKSYARAKGKGYTIIDWQAHCIMAFLFYGYYQSTNCQAVCGSGTNSYTKQTGQTNSLGMTDTKASANGNSQSINFWGLENWWGDKFEWIDNVVVDARVWKVTEADNYVRTAGTGGSSDGWISKLIIGDNLDMIPTSVGASETTHYCDYYVQSSSSSRVVLRSDVYSNTYGGVACASAYGDSSGTDSGYGSRLAFNGEVIEAESVAEFTK